MDKASLRVIKLKQREIFPDVLKQVFNENIFEQVLPYLKAAQVISCYISVRDEIDTHALIKWALNEGKTVCAPVVNGLTLEMVQLTNLSDCRVVKGLYEPTFGVVMDQFDVILVPLCCFNTKGHRIGYGKGYYDSFLKSQRALKIGLAYDWMLEDFNADPWDVGLDLIVTETKVLDFTKKR